MLLKPELDQLPAFLSKTVPSIGTPHIAGSSNSPGPAKSDDHRLCLDSGTLSKFSLLVRGCNHAGPARSYPHGISLPGPK